MSEKRYSTVVVDPPWEQRGGPLIAGVGEGWEFPGEQRSAPLPYPTMNLGELAHLPVNDWAAPNAHLYLWTTNAHIVDAYKLLVAWGFRHSTFCVWAKNLMGGGLGSDAFGISTEFFLFARRGVLPAQERIAGTWFNWKRRYDDRGKPMHSAKPLEFFDLVERVSPGPHLEVFSREKRPRLGWDYYGDESLGTAELPVALAGERTP